MHNPSCGTDPGLPAACGLDREALYRDMNEVRALAMALQAVIEVNGLNSNAHPTWMLSDMLATRLIAIEARVSP